MSVTVNTNIASLQAQSAVMTNQRRLDASMTQLSTGKRINEAADDAAGLAISSRLTSQVRGIANAINNAHDAIGMLDTVDGAMRSMEASLQRMRELGIQSLNGSNSTSERQLLNYEFKALFLELKDIADNTMFNGKRVLDEEHSLSFQISPQPGVTFDFDLENFSFDIFSSWYGEWGLMSGTPRAVGDTFEILGSAPFGSNYGTMSEAYAADYPDQSLTGRQSAHVYKGTITLGDAEIVALINSGDTSRDNMDTISSYLTGELQKIDGFESAGVWWSNGSYFVYHNPFADGYRVDIGSFSSSAGIAGLVADPAYANNQFHIVYDHVTKNAVEIVDARLAEVAEYQAKVGAAVNALYSVIDNLSSAKANSESSRSRIRDADYAKTTAQLARNQIVQQAGMAMIAQANALPEIVLKLLRT